MHSLIHIDRDVLLEMRDGVKISADIYDSTAKTYNIIEKPAKKQEKQGRISKYIVNIKRKAEIFCTN